MPLMWEQYEPDNYHLPISMRIDQPEVRWRAKTLIGEFDVTHIKVISENRDVFWWYPILSKDVGGFLKSRIYIEGCAASSVDDAKRQAEETYSRCVRLISDEFQEYAAGPK